jgi:hypothetical protein
MEVLQSAKTYVVEETTYDGWNGGTYGHDVIFFLSPEIMGGISFDAQKTIEDTFRDDLNRCAPQSNEHFSAVRLELDDEGDLNFQRAIPFSGRAPANLNILSIWKPGYIRLFVSHRDHHKALVAQLAEALDAYGICAFVAHDTIGPMTTWQHEILKGLETMEIMLAFVTSDFHESAWTNQEIGYALGKGIPVISLKLERKDPPGFIGAFQALKANLSSPSQCVGELYALLSDKLGQKERLERTLISAFSDSPNFDEARVRFDRMASAITSLSDDDLQFIIDKFAENDQLHNAIYLVNKYQRLTSFLTKCTKRKFTIKGNTIVELSSLRDEIPF